MSTGLLPPLLTSVGQTVVLAEFGGLAGYAVVVAPEGVAGEPGEFQGVFGGGGVDQVDDRDRGTAE